MILWLLLAFFQCSLATLLPHLWLKTFDKKETNPALPEGWSYCQGFDPKQSIFRLQSVTVAPYPPKRGRSLQVNVKGNLLESIKGDSTASLTYTVKYGPVMLVRDSTSLCEGLRMDPTALPQCPLAAGPWSWEYHGEVPMETPLGTFSIAAEATMADGRPIMCVEGRVSVGLLNQMAERTLEDEDDKMDQRVIDPNYSCAAHAIQELEEADAFRQIPPEGIDLQ